MAAGHLFIKEMPRLIPNILTDDALRFLLVPNSHVSGVNIPLRGTSSSMTNYNRIAKLVSWEYHSNILSLITTNVAMQKKINEMSRQIQDVTDNDALLSLSLLKSFVSEGNIPLRTTSSSANNYISNVKLESCDYHSNVPSFATTKSAIQKIVDRHTMSVKATKKKKKKTVHFHQTVRVAPFERVNTEEAKRYWYNTYERKVMKQELQKEIVNNYAKLKNDPQKSRFLKMYIRLQKRLQRNRCRRRNISKINNVREKKCDIP